MLAQTSVKVGHIVTEARTQLLGDHIFEIQAEVKETIKLLADKPQISSSFDSWTKGFTTVLSICWFYYRGIIPSRSNAKFGKFLNSAMLALGLKEEISFTATIDFLRTTAKWMDVKLRQKNPIEKAKAEAELRQKIVCDLLRHPAIEELTGVKRQPYGDFTHIGMKAYKLAVQNNKLEVPLIKIIEGKGFETWKEALENTKKSSSNKDTDDKP